MMTVDASILWVLGFGTVAVALATFLALVVLELGWLDLGSAISWLLVIVTGLCLAAQLWWTVPYIIEDDVPSMHALVELRSGDRVRIHFLHPAPPSPTENPESA
ncbi:hypothetical protein [Marinobacter sp. F4206]|uniref:hypothetical protein n=1 Tax=Marinobacter sp. F4206 TaxID=2861777 RepID=UPI002151AA59|nr:hypothetical protein [Marinobacter sp. F4206]